MPKAELAGEMGDAHMALQARLMSQALRKLTHSLSKSDTLLIFINQVSWCTASSEYWVRLQDLHCIVSLQCPQSLKGLRVFGMRCATSSAAVHVSLCSLQLIGIEPLSAQR